ncbi:hypothetical protein GQ42DRAFT_159507 [Ramicandelaber brevisporus]|nr:hypothetical protein GQ42DRAFT_159507 [Ramicandelaber brevisporus]
MYRELLKLMRVGRYPISSHPRLEFLDRCFALYFAFVLQRLHKWKSDIIPLLERDILSLVEKWNSSDLNLQETVDRFVNTNANAASNNQQQVKAEVYGLTPSGKEAAWVVLTTSCFASSDVANITICCLPLLICEAETMERVAVDSFMNKLEPLTLKLLQERKELLSDYIEGIVTGCEELAGIIGKQLLKEAWRKLEINLAVEREKDLLKSTNKNVNQQSITAATAATTNTINTTPQSHTSSASPSTVVPLNTDDTLNNTSTVSAATATKQRKQDAKQSKQAAKQATKQVHTPAPVPVPAATATASATAPAKQQQQQQQQTIQSTERTELPSTPSDTRTLSETTLDNHGNEYEAEEFDDGDAESISTNADQPILSRKDKKKAKKRNKKQQKQQEAQQQQQQQQQQGSADGDTSEQINLAYEQISQVRNEQDQLIKDQTYLSQIVDGLVLKRRTLENLLGSSSLLPAEIGIACTDAAAAADAAAKAVESMAATLKAAEEAGTAKQQQLAVKEKRQKYLKDLDNLDNCKKKLEQSAEKVNRVCEALIEAAESKLQSEQVASESTGPAAAAATDTATTAPAPVSEKPRSDVKAREESASKIKAAKAQPSKSQKSETTATAATKKPTPPPAKQSEPAAESKSQPQAQSESEPEPVPVSVPAPEPVPAPKPVSVSVPPAPVVPAAPLAEQVEQEPSVEPSTESSAEPLTESLDERAIESQPQPQQQLQQQQQQQPQQAADSLPPAALIELVQVMHAQANHYFDAFSEMRSVCTSNQQRQHNTGNFIWASKQTNVSRTRPVNSSPFH